jgi:type IV pilus assembly protein PilB
VGYNFDARARAEDTAPPCNAAKLENMDASSKPPEASAIVSEKDEGGPATAALVEELIKLAFSRGACDLHFETFQDSFRIRMRVDGALYEPASPPTVLSAPILRHVKRLAGIDPGETGACLSGLIKFETEGHTKADLRVSFVPTAFGESLVVRFHYISEPGPALDDLGVEGPALERFREALRRPVGMILVTGPRGSGKTTTLYGALRALDRPQAKVFTIEERVKSALPCCNQVEITPVFGFSDAIAAFIMDHAADVIMVGDVGELKSARAAAAAAAEGLLIAARLHGFDAAEAVARVLSMGVEPYLVASALSLVTAQRLVRRLCPRCRRPVQPSIEALIDVGVKMRDVGSFTVFGPTGCPDCLNTGYKGRTGIFEIMPVSDEIKELILAGASATALRREAERLGMQNLRAAGVQKIKAGVTSVEEIARVYPPK